VRTDRIAATGTALALALAIASCGSTASTAGSGATTTNASPTPAAGESTGVPSLPSLPQAGLAVQTTTGVKLVDLEGKELAHLDGYTLTINWRPDQTVSVQDPLKQRLALDPATNTLVPASEPPPQQPSDWPTIPPPPPTADVTVVNGHWASVVPSPDGQTLLGQWSGECEVPAAFFIPNDGEARSVWAPNWPEAQDTLALGWAPDGRAVIFLMGDFGCGEPAPDEGVYLVDLNRNKQFVISTSAAQLWHH
jgi:hypothetical protein